MYSLIQMKIYGYRSKARQQWKRGILHKWFRSAPSFRSMKVWLPKTVMLRSIAKLWN